MTGNVVRIGGVHVPGEVNPVLIDMLETLLDRAKRGEVVAVAYAAVTAIGEGTTAWEQNDTMTNPLAAPILALQYRYAKAMLD